jgi:hypothetical protein
MNLQRRKGFVRIARPAKSSPSKTVDWPDGVQRFDEPWGAVWDRALPWVASLRAQ